MSRSLNRALLAQLAAANKPKVALEDATIPGTEENPVVEPVIPPVEGSDQSTPAAVAAAAGEQGAADPAAAAPAAPTVIIKVEVEQASKPAQPAVVTEVPADDVAPTGGDASAAAATDVAAAAADTAVDSAVDAAAGGETAAPAAATADVPGDASVPPADAGAEPEVATDAVGDTGAAETPAETPAADTVPAEGETAAAAPAEAAPEGGEAAAAAAPEATPEAAATEPAAEPVAETPPAEGATDAATAADAAAPAAAEPAAEIPPAEAADAAPEAGAEGGEGGEAAVPPVDAGSADNAELPVDAAAATAEAPAEGAGEVTDAQVDAKPTEAEKDEAAAEVAAAIAAAKGEEDEVNAAAKEELGAPAVEPEGTDAAASQVEDALPVIDEVELNVAEDPAPEIEAVANEIDSYQGGAQTLERIGEVLAEAAEEGGINESGAKVLEVAVEGIHNLLHLPRPKGILAMECFAEPGTRISATTIAMEAVSETAKAAWKTVWEAIQGWLTKLGDFYNKLASGAITQGKRAEGVLAAVAKLGDKSAEGSISSPTLVKALSRGNSVSNNVAGELLAMNKLMDSAIEHGTALASAIPSLVTWNDSEVAKEAYTKLLQQHVAAVLKPDPNLSDVGVADAPEGTLGYATLPMLGNVVLWSYVPKSTETLGRLQFGRHNVEVESAGGELPVLNTAQVKAVASIVLNMSKSLADLRKAEQAIKTAASAFGNYVQQGAAAEGEAKPDPALASAVRQNTAGLLMHASKIAYVANATALAYCEASLKKLGAGEQEAAAPAAAPAAA